MPSPNSITDLVIFTVIATIAVVGFMILSRYTGWGKNLTGDWKPGPTDIDASLARSGKITRPKYIDPLSRFNPLYAIPPVLVLMLLVFIFYFATKNTFQSGN